MDWNKIENLLERYYDGETSLAEEQEIRNAFQGGNVPHHLQAEAELMGYIAKAGTEKSSAEFKQPSSGGSVVNMQPKRNFSINIRRFIAAASIILIIGVGIKFWGPTAAGTNDCSNQVLATINNQEICDKELAKEEARKALLLISSKLNKGTNEMGHLKTLNKPSEITQRKK